MKRTKPLNLSMLFDFYEMTMANGYYRMGMQEHVTYFDVFSAGYRTAAASLSRRAWSSWWSISRTCTSTRRTLPT